MARRGSPDLRELWRLLWLHPVHLLLISLLAAAAADGARILGSHALSWLGAYQLAPRHDPLAGQHRLGLSRRPCRIPAPVSGVRNRGLHNWRKPIGGCWQRGAQPVVRRTRYGARGWAIAIVVLSQRVLVIMAPPTQPTWRWLRDARPWSCRLPGSFRQAAMRLRASACWWSVSFGLRPNRVPRFRAATEFDPQRAWRRQGHAELHPKIRTGANVLPAPEPAASHLPLRGCSYSSLM